LRSVEAVAQGDRNALNTGHSPMGLRTAQIDPEPPFKIALRTGGKRKKAVFG